MYRERNALHNHRSQDTVSLMNFRVVNLASTSRLEVIFFLLSLLWEIYIFFASVSYIFEAFGYVEYTVCAATMRSE